MFLPAAFIFICGYAGCPDVIQAPARADTITPGQSPRDVPGKDVQSKISKVRLIYTAELGIREEGANTGSRVEEYLEYAGLKKGDPWCAAFVCWVYGRAGVPNPRSGWSPALFPASKVIWKRKRPNMQEAADQPGAGDIFALWFPQKDRIAHTGFVDEWEGAWAVTVEGNTNRAGSPEGDGVYRKRRLKSSLYEVARWIVRGSREK